ncbi:MAG: BamA/TamA family outer membrane protein [Chloroherpetonaceae bacterium]|nr:BamA/TamA family outer membrane protein [Chloroherpetonaceae bacterium]
MGFEKKFISIYACFVFGLILLTQIGFSQESPETVAKSSSDTSSMMPMPVKLDNGIVIPIVFTSPETRIGGGVVGVYYYRFNGEPVESRPSNVKGDIIFTQQRQIFIQLIPQFYFGNEENFFDTEFSFIRFTDRFWGIGSQTPVVNEEQYANDIIRLRIGYYRRLKQAVNFGLIYHFENFTIRERKVGGLLEQGGLFIGNNGARVSGLGLAFNYDSRNNLFSPSEGVFTQLTTTLYLDLLGSQTNFYTFVIDARKYFSVIDHHVIALQGYFSGAEGDAPFQLLPRLGGNARMRGFFEGRFRDKLFLAAQAEYRFPLVWRFGGVVFGGIGEVASRIQQFWLPNFQISYGFGLRFSINPDEKVNLRLDFGFGKNTSGIYLTVNEAF